MSNSSSSPQPQSSTNPSSHVNKIPMLLAESLFDFVMIEMISLLESCTPHSAEDRKAIYFKLELLGFDVGLRLIERLVKDHSPFKDTLDKIKFICKEFWICLFHKQVDNLKTNHRGVFVLQDIQFLWFINASSNLSPLETVQAMKPYLWYPCGVIRGALSGLGLDTVVMAESMELPQCTFQIKFASMDN